MVLKRVYLNEWEQYADLYEKQVSQEDARKIVKKLRRHFKIPVYKQGLAFTNRSGGRASEYGITLPNSQLIQLGLIAHEVAHQVAWEKYGLVHHNKKYKRSMKKIVNYIRKKDYWSDSIPFTLDMEYRKNIPAWKYSYERRYQMRKSQKCPARNGGLHVWTCPDGQEFKCCYCQKTISQTEYESNNY